MSYLYDNPQEQAKLSDTLDRMQHTPATPGFFSNFWGASGAGLARGGLKLAELGTYFSDPDSLMAQQMMAGFTGDTTDYVKKDQEDRAAARQMLAQKAIELTPNPLITGTGSKIASGFAEIVPTMVAGGALAGPFGAGVLVGGAQGVGDYQESVLQGIDPETAAKKAALTGVVAGVGAVVPMSKMGAGLATNLGIGAGVNLATGAIQRGGTAAILEAGGYKDQAAQYKVLDGEAILIDTILGAAFGGVGHYLGRKPTSEQLAAALKLNERQHIEIEGQPGIHKTPESRQAGVEAFEDTLRGLLTEDRPPDVTSKAAAMNIEPNPQTVAAFHEAKAALEEELPGLADWVNQYPRQEQKTPFQALRDFEEGQQAMLLSAVQQAGVSLEALRNLGLATSMKEAFSAGMGRLVKSKERGGMSEDALAEHLHQLGWIQSEDVNELRQLLSQVFAKKGQREPVVHSSMQDEHARLTSEAANDLEYRAYVEEQARMRARAAGEDEAIAAQNPEAANDYFDKVAERTRKAEAAVDPNAPVKVEAIDPRTGKTERVPSTAGEALRDNGERLQKMKGLLECLLG